MEFSNRTIDEYEKGMRLLLPSTVRTELLTIADDWPHNRDHPFRPMGAAEAANAYEMLLPERFRLRPLGKVAFLWTDDESNFAGVYVDGVIPERIVILDHEGSLDTSPLYRSAISFADALKSQRTTLTGWWRIPVDFPNSGDEAVRPAGQAQSATDLDAVNHLLSLLDGDLTADSKRAISYAALSLVPPDQSGMLAAWVYHRDTFIASKACRMMGCKRNLAALNDLAQLAETRTSVIRTDAIQGIGLLGTPDARRVLLKMVDYADHFMPVIGSALNRTGLDIRQASGIYYVKEAAGWTELLAYCHRVGLNSTSQPVWSKNSSDGKGGVSE